jgi:hypothetical protein
MTRLALNDTPRFVGRRSLSGRSGQVQTSAWPFQSRLTDAVEKGQNEPVEIFACVPVEAGFS